MGPTNGPLSHLRYVATLESVGDSVRSRPGVASQSGIGQRAPFPDESA